jgi:hypothetical protein
MPILSSVKPFGNPNTAKVLVVGHDPRLQRSDAEAEYAFFFEFLKRSPKNRGEVQKQGLARAVRAYLKWLAGYEIPLDQLYVTNLCNEFIERQQSGVIYIPEAQARHGVQSLTDTVAQGQFKVIIPMAEQTFYWLCQLGFVEDADERVQTYIQIAQPKVAKAKLGVYVKSGKAPFVTVCGQRFHHQGVPIIPILHVNRWTWPLPPRRIRYEPGMEQARDRIQQALSG